MFVQKQLRDKLTSLSCKQVLRPLKPSCHLLFMHAFFKVIRIGFWDQHKCFKNAPYYCIKACNCTQALTISYNFCNHRSIKKNQNLKKIRVFVNIVKH